jgi:hypothetical protein
MTTTRETFPEFLARVHRDDVASGKDVMHHPGVCETCDEHRKEQSNG